MTNKDYKQLYLEFQKENTKLKQELENKIAVIDFIYEELDLLLNKIDKTHSYTEDLYYARKNTFNKIKEFSENLDLDLKNKTK